MFSLGGLLNGVRSRAEKETVKGKRNGHDRQRKDRRLEAVGKYWRKSSAFSFPTLAFRVRENEGAARKRSTHKEENKKSKKEKTAKTFSE